MELSSCTAVNLGLPEKQGTAGHRSVIVKKKRKSKAEKFWPLIKDGENFGGSGHVVGGTVLDLVLVLASAGWWCLLVLIAFGWF